MPNMVNAGVPDKIGKTTVAVAMLDVNSVVNKTKMLTSATSKKSGMELNTFKCFPIKFDSPDLEKPSASAMPPVRSMLVKGNTFRGRCGSRTG